MSVRVAIVGAGRMGKHHAGRLREVPNAQIVATADVDLPRAQELAEPFGARAYADHREMLAAEKIDAVYICTPAPQHAEQAIDAARAGVALYIEKPVTWDLASAKRVADAVEQAGVICTVGYQWRHMPAVQRAVAALGGEPVALARAHYYWTIPLVPAIRDKETGGGQVFDQVTHQIDLSRLFAGEVESVRAEYTLNARKGEFNNWDGYSVTLRYKSGAVGSFASTYALFQTVKEPPTLDICAKERLFRITPAGVEVRTPAGTEMWTDADTPIDAAFIQAVATGDRSLILSPVRDGLQTLAVTLAANRSAETGRTIWLDSFIQEA